MSGYPDLSRSMIQAMKNVAAGQQAIADAAARCGKDSQTDTHGNAAGPAGALDVIALLAGNRQSNPVGRQVGSGLAAALLSAFADALAGSAESAKDPVVAPGTPPLTKSLVSGATECLSKGLGISFRYPEARTLEGLLCDLWKAGRQEEIASVLALVSHSHDPAGAEPAAAAALVVRFLALPWSLPFLVWAHGVLLRAQYAGHSPDLETEKALSEAVRLRNEVETLKRELAESRARESATARELDRVRSERKAGIEEQVRLQRKLDEALVPSHENPDDDPERRIRQILLRLKTPGLMIDPHIPPKKLLNARSECKMPAAEKVLALIDLTVFGSAKDAIAFGLEGIYYHCYSTTLSIAWSEFQNREAHHAGVQLKVLANGQQSANEQLVNSTDFPAPYLKSLLEDIDGALGN